MAQGAKIGTSSGTGVIDSFLRVAHQGNDTFQEGYNTDFRPVEYDENTDANFTDSILLADIPIRFGSDIDINGDGVADLPVGQFYELRLDLNQNNSDHFISLEALSLYLGTDPNLTDFDSQYDGGTGFAGDNDVLVYNMDGVDPDGTAKNDEEIYVILNALESGSGDADSVFYINKTYFDSALDSVENSEDYEYFYLYSAFGGDIYQDDVRGHTSYTLTKDAEKADADGDFDGENDSLEASLGDTVSVDTNSNFEEWNVIKEPKITIAGEKFVDLDADGTKDAGEGDVPVGQSLNYIAGLTAIQMVPLMMASCFS